jgi:uncharacterized protein YbcV (DUF1398 family)
MTPEQQSTAERCLHAADAGTMTFPQIVGALIAAGFDGYLVDLRAAQNTYYTAAGESLALPHPVSGVPIAATFDQAAVVAAIREAQALVPGYTYRGFCDQVMHAGCAGYLVSFSGRRVLYFGRTAETHVEHFPK